MQNFGAVLRIHGPVNYHGSIVAHFGREACSWHKAGDRVAADLSFLPIKNWPSDIVLVTPQVKLRSSVMEHVGWCCDKLVQNDAFVRELIANETSMEVSCWCNTSENIGDFRLSSEQVKTLANYGVGVFFRFIVNEVFAE